MKYDFDRPARRTERFRLKYEDLGRRFGRPDVLPLWVADMDFPTAEPVIRALTARAAEGIFGYTSQPASFFEAFSRWQADRHGWRPNPGRMSYCPGVVPALAALVHLFSAEGEEILIQPPVYQAFASTIKAWGRRVLASPLRETAGRYTVDFDDFTRALRRRPAFFILCSPHNPVGRVWTREELAEMARLCREHGVRLVADEIHSDLVFRGHVHLPAACLPEMSGNGLVTCLSATKTFNLAGLQASVAVFAAADDQSRFEAWWRKLGVDRNNCFGLEAVEAALRDGAEWLDQLLDYLEGNFQFIRDYCARHIPAVKPNLPEGTYLVWLDCRGLGLTEADLPGFLARRAGLGLNNGAAFGTGGAGFMRLNAACPRSVLRRAMEQLRSAADTLKGSEQ